MKIVALPLAGTFELSLRPSADPRGSFMRWYDREIFARHGLTTDWVQANESHSRRNVVRGMHFQRAPHAETKLVRVIAGAIYDVCIDLRRTSPSFGRWQAIELAADKHNAVLIPKGFAHGFCVVSTEAIVSYLVDSPYAPDAEGGVLWNDPDLEISWPIAGNAVVSDKDRILPRLRDVPPLE